ncbi:MAG TPA: hypothetical protein VKA50_07380 [Gammaproteobacteria bacterium]|nr:hypothetical protein [Gammaproteobacteria bacterium]
MSKTTVTKLHVLVDRDAGQKIPCVIFDFELPILEDIHAREGSLVHELDSWQVELDDFDAQRAHAGLMSKYNQPETQAIVRSHYRGARELARRTGLPIGDTTQVQQQSLVNTRNPEREAFLQRQADAIKAKQAHASDPADPGTDPGTGTEPADPGTGADAGTDPGAGTDPANPGVDPGLANEDPSGDSGGEGGQLTGS